MGTKSMVSHQFALERYGFIYGFLLRCQLLHKVLLKNAERDDSRPEKPWIFETISCLFDKMPIASFFKIIGVPKVTKSLLDYSHEHPDVLINELPEDLKQETSLWRKRHFSQSIKLLDALTKLGLIVPDDQYPSLGFKLPMQYRLAEFVPFYNVNSIQIEKFVKLNYEEHDAALGYWEELKSLSCDFRNERVSSLYDDEFDQKKIPRIISMALLPQSWLTKRSRITEIEKKARRLGIKYFAYRKSFKRRVGTYGQISMNSAELDDEIRKTAREFEMDEEKFKSLVEHCIQALEGKEEVEKIEKSLQKNRSLQPRISSSGKESEDEYQEGKEDDREFWTEEDRSRLKLVFCLLNLEQFKAVRKQWFISCRVFDPPKTPVIIRRYGQKIARAYEEFEGLMGLGMKVRWIAEYFTLFPGEFVKSAGSSPVNEGINDEMDDMSEIGEENQAESATKNAEKIKALAAEFKDWFDNIYNIIDNDKVIKQMILKVSRFGGKSSPFSLNDYLTNPGRFSVVEIKNLLYNFEKELDQQLIPRSFRNELMLHNEYNSPKKIPCTASIEVLQDSSFLKYCYAIRKIMTFCAVDANFSAMEAYEYLKRIGASIKVESEEIREGLVERASNFLYEIQFLSKSRGKNRFRLRGFSMNISEAVLDVFGAIRNDNDEFNLDLMENQDGDFAAKLAEQIKVLSNSTNIPALNRNPDIIKLCLKAIVSGNLELEPSKTASVVSKDVFFDHKVNLILKSPNAQDENLNLATLNQKPTWIEALKQHGSNVNFLWFDYRPGEGFREEIASCSTRYVQKMVEKYPGIDEESIIEKCWPILFPEEVCSIVESLLLSNLADKIDGCIIPLCKVSI